MMKSGLLDYWRGYFRKANSDIFAIIDHAIMVAVADCPKEFLSRRDRIAERLFSCRLTKCSGCNHVEVAVPSREGEDEGRDNGNGTDDEEEDEEENIDIEGKVNNSSNRDSNIGNGELNASDDQLVSNYSYVDYEALTDELEEESQVVGEVFRIKDILLNCRDESDSVLYESLRRLQLMALSVDTLKSTEIGKAVNFLRKKHGSEKICQLAKTLIEGWKILVDEWYNATKTIKGDEGTPESVNPSIVDEEEEEEEEEGLPSPPLDEGAFFATQPIELSQIFDGMDDDGNPRNSGEFLKNHGNVSKLSSENHTIIKRKQKNSNEGPRTCAVNNRNQQMKRQEAVVKQSRPSNTDSGPGRPPRQRVEQRLNKELKLQHRIEKVNGQRKPSSGQQDKLKSSDELAVQTKLEATKRKLQESYQQAENAKRQRTIQVMELRDLPKQGLGHKISQQRPGNHNRHWAQGRR